MKKLESSLLIAAALLVSNVYAGGPTAEPMMAQSKPALFATVEGGYTWNDVGSTTFNYLNTTTGQTFIGSPAKTTSGGTGRVAIGAIHYSPSNPDLSYTAEMGWGYYGKTSFQSTGNFVSSKNYIYGVDLLGGVDYKVNSMFDLFAKAGALLQNTRMVRNYNLNPLVNVVENQTTTVSSVIPEIKLGGIYNLSDVWGLSLSYLHAFGNSPSMSISKTVTAGTVVASSYSSTGAPISTNSVLAGVAYKFA